MTLLVVGVGFDFVEIYFQKNKSDSPYFQTYIEALQFVTTTITTAGNTDVLIRKPEALIITIFIMFSGIIFYGYLFRQMMNVLSLMKTF